MQWHRLHYLLALRVVSSHTKGLVMCVEGPWAPHYWLWGSVWRRKKTGHPLLLIRRPRAEARGFAGRMLSDSCPGSTTVPQCISGPCEVPEDRLPGISLLSPTHQWCSIYYWEDIVHHHLHLVFNFFYWQLLKFPFLFLCLLQKEIKYAAQLWGRVIRSHHSLCVYVFFTSKINSWIGLQSSKCTYRRDVDWGWSNISSPRMSGSENV